jgi:uncharacterized protein YndB with AHSA1/START domain
MQFAVALDRVFAAPRSKVYRAWLDPELLAGWMGPEGSAVVIAEVDERVGGRHFVEMIGADGEHFTFTSVIEELVPDERIVLTFKFHHTASETLLTLSFSDAEDGGTRLRLEHERLTHEGQLTDQNVNEGWSQTLAKLQALLTD